MPAGFLSECEASLLCVQVGLNRHCSSRHSEKVGPKLLQEVVQFLPGQIILAARFGLLRVVRRLPSASTQRKRKRTISG
jgi:hypothetical protein